MINFYIDENFFLNINKTARYLSWNFSEALFGVDGFPVIQFAEDEGQLGRDLQMVDTGHGSIAAGLKKSENTIENGNKLIEVSFG